MKDHIEGPPRRAAPILLRQTSYKALTEPVIFDGATPGAHTARFGEIEQRGLALTPAGRRRYDEALAQVEAIRAAGRAPSPADYEAAYAVLPDDFAALRQAGLGYFHYEATEKGAQPAWRWSCRVGLRRLRAPPTPSSPGASSARARSAMRTSCP